MPAIFDALPGIEVPVGAISKSLSDMWADTAAAGGNAPTVDDAKATQVNFVLHLGFHTQAADAVAQFRTAVEFSKRCPSRVVVPWQFFSNLIAAGTESVVGNLHLVTKIYFPRVILVLSSTLVAISEFFLAAVCLAPLLFLYGVTPQWTWLLAGVFAVQALFAGIGVSWWLAALNVYYRDVRLLAPFIVQIGLYVSPVAYPATLIPGAWRVLYGLNPMVGPIDGFRWAFLGEAAPLHWPSYLLSLAVTIALNAYGIRTFNRLERDFADHI